MVTVKQIGKKIKDLVAKAEGFNALSEEIAGDLLEAPNEELMELFTKVKNHEIEDAKTLMQCMRELNCFEEINEKVDCDIAPEIIEKFTKKERKATGADQVLLSCEPDIEEETIRLQCEGEPCLALKFSRYAITNTIAAFFIVDDENSEDNGELYDDLTVCLGNEYPLRDYYTAFVKSDKLRYLEVLQKRGILTCHQEVSYGNFYNRAVLVRFDPEKVVFED